MCGKYRGAKPKRYGCNRYFRPLFHLSGSGSVVAALQSPSSTASPARGLFQSTFISPATNVAIAIFDRIDCPRASSALRTSQTP
jgi:hypothetical protein